VPSENRCWEAVRPAKEQFGQVLEPIQNFLSSQHEQLSKGISARKALLLDIYMIGPTAEQARPTIIFTCENKTQRQLAQKLVRNSKLLDQYPGFSLGESARSLRLTMSPQPLGSDGDATVKGERNLSEYLVFYSPPLEEIYGIPIFIQNLNSQNKHNAMNWEL
jgi:hypothetical protein